MEPQRIYGWVGASGDVWVGGSLRRCVGGWEPQGMCGWVGSFRGYVGASDDIAIWKVSLISSLAKKKMD